MAILHSYSSDQRIQFANCCVRCGSVATSSWECAATRGVNVFGLRLGRQQEFDVPVCTQCWAIRRVGGSAAMIFLSFATLIGVGLLMPWLDGNGKMHIWLVLFALAALALCYYGPNHHGRLANRFLLKVWAVLNADDSVQLWVANAEIESRLIIRGLPRSADRPAMPRPEYSAIDRLARHAYYGPRLPPLGGVLLGVAALLLNHWYAVTSERYYPIALYLCGLLIFLGLGGLWNPAIFFVPNWQDEYPLARHRARVMLIALGLAFGAFLHVWLYHFSMESTIPFK